MKRSKIQRFALSNMFVNLILEGGEVKLASMVKDPVCGMEIDPHSAAGQTEFNGQIYYFCSFGCIKAFDEEPEKYVGKLKYSARTS